MSKVLMLTSPHISIRKTMPFPPLFYGAAEICGALDNVGYDVHHYDLNGALNKIRGSYELTEEDNLILKTVPALLNKDFNFITEGDSIFIKWIDELVKIIDIHNYNFIGISLSSRYTWHPKFIYVVDAFNFALLLSYKLKEIFPKSKIYMGGKKALRIIPKEEFYRAMVTPDMPIDAVFMGEAKNIFPQHLKRRDKYSTLETHVIYTNESRDPQYLKNVTKSLAVPPYWDIKNRSDVMWDPNSVIPDVVKEEFPVLNEIKPFNTASYVFTHGCKFKCAFCTNAGGTYRTLHVKNVVDVIERIYDQGYDSFTFYNTSINADTRYTIKVCNEIVRRNLKIKFSDSAALSHMTPEITKALSESGCIKLSFGVESGSDRMLKLINKRVTVEKIHEKLELSHKAGIWNAINLIVSFPNETEEEFAETKEISRYKYVDCFYAHIFDLYQLSEYISNPSKFDIKLRNFTCTREEVAIIHPYDDLYCTWEEKVIQEQERLISINEEGGVENLIKCSDELLFSISQVMEEKEMKIDFFNSMFTNLSKEELENIRYKIKDENYDVPY